MKIKDLKMKIKDLKMKIKDLKIGDIVHIMYDDSFDGVIETISEVIGMPDYNTKSFKDHISLKNSNDLDYHWNCDITEGQIIKYIGCRDSAMDIITKNAPEYLL